MPHGQAQVAEKEVSGNDGRDDRREGASRWACPPGTPSSEEGDAGHAHFALRLVVARGTGRGSLARKLERIAEEISPSCAKPSENPQVRGGEPCRKNGGLAPHSVPERVLASVGDR